MSRFQKISPLLSIHRFHWAHIWSCPPGEGDDYIFHCHPVAQKFPKHKKLVEWYKRCLEKAIDENVVYEYKVRYQFITILYLYLLLISFLYVPWVDKYAENCYFHEVNYTQNNF